MNIKRGYKQIRQLDKEEMIEYGEFFKSMRESIGLSREMMGKEIGVFRTTISLWERAKCVPQMDIDQIVNKYREVVKKYKN